MITECLFLRSTGRIILAQAVGGPKFRDLREQEAELNVS